MESMASVSPHYSLFIKKSTGSIGRFQKKISNISWGLLKENIENPVTGDYLFSPSSAQDTTVYTAKGVSTNPQGDMEIMPVIYLLSLASFSVAIVCATLYIMEQVIAASNKSGEYKIKSQLGCSNSYWVKLTVANALISATPILIMTLIIEKGCLYIYPKISFLSTIFNGNSSGLWDYTHISIFTICFIASAIINGLSIEKSLSGKLSNKTSVTNEGGSSLIVNKTLFLLSVTSLVAGIVISTFFVHSVSSLISTDKVGLSKDMWTIKQSNGTGLGLEASGVIKRTLESMSIKSTLLTYEPGIDPLENPVKISSRHMSDPVSVFFVNTDGDFAKNFGLSYLFGQKPQLNSLNEVSISMSAAKQIASNPKDAIGQLIYVNSLEQSFKITGVLSDVN
jgi:hypothetical protein